MGLPDRRPRAERGAPLALLTLLLLLLAFALRLAALDRKNVWLDEAWTWEQTQRPVRALLVVTAGDVHPPLHPLLMKAWTAAFGDSPAALRFPSVLAGVAVLLLAFRLGSPDLPPAALAAALAWLAASPHAIATAQDARMYALTSVAAVGACAAYRRWLDSGGVRKAALAEYAAWAAAGVYLHYFSALVVAAATVHLLAVRRRLDGAADGGAGGRPLVDWAKANAVVGALFLPWLPVAVRQVARGQDWRADVPPAGIPGFGADLARGLLLGFDDAASFATPSGLVLLAVAAAGIGRLLFLVAAGRGRAGDGLFLSVLGVPAALALAALPWTGEMELRKYLGFLLPLLVLAVARGLTAGRSRHAAAVGALLLAAAASVPYSLSHLARTSRDSDVRPAVSYLEGTRAPGGSRDVVLVVPSYMRACARYVSRSSPVAWVGVTDAARLERAVDAASRRPVRTWVLVDYRSGLLDRASRDGRLAEVGLPGGDPSRIRLYRVRADRGGASDGRRSTGESSPGER